MDMAGATARPKALGGAQGKVLSVDSIQGVELLPNKGASLQGGAPLLLLSVPQ
jgi:hypothetical protein